MQKRISKWLSKANLQKAKGKTREEIFKEFGNELEPIAYINPEYLQHLGENLKDNRVYSGKGYFIDHAVNHHPEITPEEYGRIQDILNSPDEVKLDSRSKGKTSLIFIRKYDNYFAEVVNVDRELSNKIIFHKTYYYKEKTPQKALPNVELENLSLVDGLPTISPAKAAAVPRSISALNDSTKVKNNSETSKQSPQKNLTIAQMLEGTTPIETPKHSFKNFDEARKWAKENIIGTYKNENTGEDIYIAKNAIDKYMSASAVLKSVSKDAHMSALKAIPELLKTSLLKETRTVWDYDFIIN
jgi:hypothetical protein